MLVEERDGVLVVKTMDGEPLTRHLIPAGRGEKVINKNHRRDKSATVEAMGRQVAEQFSDTRAAEVFLSGLRERYPRYMRDQLGTMLTCLSRHEPGDADKALELCVSRGLFSANDFKSVLSTIAPAREDERGIPVTPLPTPGARLMVNIAPEKSRIDVYQDLFKSN